MPYYRTVAVLLVAAPSEAAAADALHHTLSQPHCLDHTGVRLESYALSHPTTEDYRDPTLVFVEDDPRITELERVALPTDTPQDTITNTSPMAWPAA